jgi:ribosomal protein S16
MRYLEYEYRRNQGLVNDEEKNDEEGRLAQARHNVHDAMIDSVKIYARVLVQKDRDGSWIEKMGNARAKYNYLALYNTYKKLLQKNKRRNMLEMPINEDKRWELMCEYVRLKTVQLHEGTQPSDKAQKILEELSMTHEEVVLAYLAIKL